METTAETRGAKGLYFSHDSDARADEKMIAMIAVYGFQGYGWYWAVLESMRKLPDFKLKVGGKYGLTAVASMLSGTPTFVEQWLNDCCEHFTDKFGKALFLRDGEYIFSESFTRRMEIVKQKSEKNSKAGHASAMKRAENKSIRNERSTDVEQDANLLKLKLKSNTKDSIIKNTKKSNKNFEWFDEIMHASPYWGSAEFQNAWNAYRDKREKLKFGLSERSAKTLYNELHRLANGDVVRATELVDWAENGGWRFIYDRQPQQQQSKNGTTAKTGFVNEAYANAANNIK